MEIDFVRVMLSDFDLEEALRSGMRSELVCVLNVTEENVSEVARKMYEDESYSVSVVMNENPDKDDEDLDLQETKVTARSIENAVERLIKTTFCWVEANRFILKLMDDESDTIADDLWDKFWQYLLVKENNFY
jgi:hypothetical protein